MKWLPRHTLAAGVALIALTNAVALGGAAWNRSGDPDSTLDLTDRELRPPFVWMSGGENSGLTLKLQWRLLPADNGNHVVYSYYSVTGGSPAWLDAAKMSALGFGTSPPRKNANGDPNSSFYRQLPRDVLIVLELDGSAYHEALARAANEAKELEAKNLHGNGKRDADELMNRERLYGSRLFAVDAGLDRSVLRSQYPDRKKYAILRGQVRPAWRASDQPVVGMIENLSADEVNVPLEMRGVFEGVGSDAGYASNGAKQVDARLAFGQRLEPWLISASARSANRNK